MPSMTYCAFENTVKEIEQCKELLDEVGSIEQYENECSEYEKPHIRGLVELCRDFVEQYGGE